MALRWTLTLLLVAATGCAHAEPPKPLLWKVSDADNSLYLLGSFHLLKAEDYPLAPSTDAAFDDAERVVFELPPAEMNSPALGQAMMAAAQFGDGRTLQAAVPAPTWQKVEAWAASRGMPAAGLLPLEPWFASLVISITEMQRLGLNPAHGLDKHFAARATEAGKAVEGLETGAQQIALFDGMDPAVQVQMLEDTLGDAEETEATITRMHDLWRRGDADGLFRETAAELKAEYPEVYARLNTQRNEAWMTRLQALLDEGADEDALVVVGAMHLLGDEGLVARLRAEGYTVEAL